jgi:hypothetical protein
VGVDTLLLAAATSALAAQYKPELAGRAIATIY